ncbi:MAG: ATP-binding cassette domain-containing protein [Verrucomicrobia bacterium]|nr:ATP-binding cassette domain-containing protein [Verrucomicrobiota bacterium]
MRLLLKNISAPLAHFSLEIDLELSGRAIAVVGPSGAGKTSLLDVIAGLRPVVSGVIRLGDRILADASSGVVTMPRHRGIGYVPQDLALFPHLAVRDNLLYGARRVASGGLSADWDRIVDALELRGLVDRRIHALSGGEKHRVALGRALLSSPSLLLLDEPLASLDAALKDRVFPSLERIRDEFCVPMIYVTHDRREALRIADQGVVMVEGKVDFHGSPEEAFARS